MVDIVGVRFKTGGKMYYFNPRNLKLRMGDKVIVETARGIEFGEVVVGKHAVPEKNIKPPLKNVIRLATDEDLAINAANKKKETTAFDICVEKIKKRKLDMKLIEVEYSFDGSKIMFYFTADGRVDFRELVKDLALVFHTRIELRQIGVRDEAKSLGSIGICGRGLCCASFLNDLIPVSIKMAKEQGLSLNPTKISGVCGRLMCCLKYEQDNYEALLKTTPRVGSIVQTPIGRGVVESSELLKGIVRVRVDDKKTKDTVTRDFKVSEVKQLKRAPAESMDKIDKEILKTLEDK